ncbi:restriction endonuclease subunit S [Asticcacaulis tiandongensis]|uniref:restriction endonuclease subunit S n=1 Tax=Asticcacaulis tiandongensis TaxID=2565365 RepID=UPI001125E1DC|nr:restriction endonuclease subunit S [Asticcacaulis tiandongensis]
MRDGWHRTTLSDLVEFRNGLNFTQASRGASVKVIGVGDFRNKEALSDFSETTTIVINGEVSESDMLAENDLLFVRSNGNKALIGRCVLISKVSEPLAFSGFTIRARISAPNVDHSYLSKLVRSPLFKAHLHRFGGGSSISNLSQEALSEFAFALPPLEEQKKIAEILRAWDLAIEKLEALRESNLRRRTWLRTHLFNGKVRLPGFNGEWRTVRLGDVLTEHGFVSTGNEEVFSVSVHKGLVNQIEHLGRSFAAAETSHYNRVLPGDIVYTKSPTGDFPLGIIKQSKICDEVIVSPLYGVFSPVTRAMGCILDAMFESPVAVRNYLHPLVQKGAKNTIAITNTRFLEGSLLLPMDHEEQVAIAEVIDASRAEVDLIEAEINALQKQKRGLMQKLLTGEWRVQREVAVA